MCSNPCEAPPRLGQKGPALPDERPPRHTGSQQTFPKRPSEDPGHLQKERAGKRPRVYPHKHAAYLTDGPPPGCQEHIPAPVHSRTFYNPVTNTHLLQGGRVSTGKVTLPSVSQIVSDKFENRGSSLTALDVFSLDQPSHKSRQPSLSPISPKQNCKPASPPGLRKGTTTFDTNASTPAQVPLSADGVSPVASEQVPATVQPRAPPTENKSTTPTPSHPTQMIPQGEKLGIASPLFLPPEAQAMTQTEVAQSHTACCCCCAPTKQQVTYPLASGSPAMGLPAMALPPPPHPNFGPPPYALAPACALPPHLPRAPFMPIAPPSTPHRYGQAFSPMMTPMPLGGFNGYQTPPLETSPARPVIKSKSAVTVPVSTGTQTQHVRSGQEGPFRPPPGLIQPTYRKTSPNLVVDVAETCQEKFPFYEVAARHNASVEKVVDIFAAIIQVPLLRCPTDRRRTGKLATARIREHAQARKDMKDNAGLLDIDTSSVAVAKHMGPLDLPDGST